jgi:hypothetical protein
MSLTSKFILQFSFFIVSLLHNNFVLTYDIMFLFRAFDTFVVKMDG